MTRRVSQIANKKWVVTAGPTVEAIDPVRFISNYSTGKMGYAVAEALASRGALVTLVSGPTSLPTPEGVERINVRSAEEMYEVCAQIWSEMDGGVMCAAVADYTPARQSNKKIKKGDSMTLQLVPTRDIAATLGQTKRPRQILVGFALETDNEEANALDKLARKKLDMIVLNSLRHSGAGFGVDTNLITVFDRNGQRYPHPLMSKPEAAQRIADAIESYRLP